MRKFRLSSPSQIFLVSFIAMMVAMAALGYATYRACFELLEDNLGKRAQATAQVAANLVQVDQRLIDQMLRLDVQHSRNHPAAKEFKQKMGPIISHNEVEYIYVEVKLPAHQVRHFVDPTEEEVFHAPPGTPMEYFYVLTSENESSYTDRDRFDIGDTLRERAYREKKPLFGNLSPNKWGNLMTGYAPLYDSQHKFIGFLGVDISGETFFTAIHRISTIIFVSFGILVLLGGFLLHRASQFLSKPLYQDGLTGLYNHQYMKNRLQKEISRARRYEHSLSVLMLDLDFFKQVNDNFGHQAGDYILRKISHLVQACLRDEDIACRYGGEEFAVILPETNLEQAVTVAERLRCSIQNTSFLIPGINQPVQVTASLGLAELQEVDNHITLLKRADEGLYRAKTQGRNRLDCCCG